MEPLVLVLAVASFIPIRSRSALRSVGTDSGADRQRADRELTWDRETRAATASRQFVSSSEYSVIVGFERQ